MTNQSAASNSPKLSTSPSRRRFVQTGLVAALAAGASQALARPNTALNAHDEAMPPFRYCLNTSTINGSKVPLREQLQVAASAGYDGVELWLRDIEKHLATGGTTRDLKNEIADLGLKVESAIAFGAWIVDDDEKRAVGLQQCKKDMEIVREIGGQRIAAPPSGATRDTPLDLRAAAERYHALLEVGEQTGVSPQVELWGFSKNLSTLEEVLFVAAGAKHPGACILLDVYHLYKGGNDFENIGLVPGTQMHCLHMNDYPGTPDRSNISDKDRVYPGDGVAPMDHILRTLAAGGFDGTLSLELFNRSYWEQPALEVAKTGLEKMKACVAKAFG